MVNKPVGEWYLVGCRYLLVNLNLNLTGDFDDRELDSRASGYNSS